MTKFWWKEAIAYEIYPSSFKDSNGDGIGDLRGIIEKLDYLEDLGITLVWLCPIFPSPLEDNGYDISNYYDIHPEMGQMSDFEELVEGLHERGMKLLLDIQFNHTSDEHPWFIESQKSKDNPYRDFYYWRPGNNGSEPNNWPSLFGGKAWSYDKHTDEYYLHLFSKKQPDLNWYNPEVREKLAEVVKFWTDKGVDGFRYAAITMIAKKLEDKNVDLSSLSADSIKRTFATNPGIHELIKDFNQKTKKDCMHLGIGEAIGVPSENIPDFTSSSAEQFEILAPEELAINNFGPKGRFDIMPESWIDIKRIINRWDNSMDDNGWINIIIDNHDVLRMVSRFGDDQEYRVESSKLLLTLMCTLRGTPCIYQGSEIGMTNMVFDDPDDYKDVETLKFIEKELKDGRDEYDIYETANYSSRDNARTPMQWDDSQNAGFTTGDPWISVNPNYEEINVEKEQNNEDSILNYLKQIIKFRKENPVFVYGSFQDLLPNHPTLFVYLRQGEESKKYLVVLNCSSHRANYRMPPEYHQRTLVFSNYHENIYAEKVMLQLRPWEACIFKVEYLV